MRIILLLFYFAFFSFQLSVEALFSEIQPPEEREKALFPSKSCSAKNEEVNFSEVIKSEIVTMKNSIKEEAKRLKGLETRETDIKALKLLNSLLEEPKFLNALKDSKDLGEMYYLRALFAFEIEENEKCQKWIEEALNFQDPEYADLLLDLLGSFYFKTKEFEKAAAIFSDLEAKYKTNDRDRDFGAESLYKAAFSLSFLEGEEERVRTFRKRLYKEYPNSKYAAECYFLCYSFQEYAEGSAESIKHLKSFLKHVSNSPFLIDACYLLGLDCKRDRKTAEGKWLAKKNLAFALNYFQKAENYFKEFTENGILEKENVHYQTVRYLSALEKALLNFNIAEESSGSKKEIYLEYAKKGFLEIREDFKKSDTLLKKIEPYPSILEESSYWLGMTYLKLQEMLLARDVFSEMVDTYQALNIKKGYFLSRALYELGLIAKKSQDPSLAIEFFAKAEEASYGNILNSRERLTLWIQQALSFLDLDQFDSAILLLSKAVNDESLSSIRLEAMFYRALVYESQGRDELSKKQLESLVKKGGEWGLKAKQKLEGN